MKTHRHPPLFVASLFLLAISCFILCNSGRGQERGIGFAPHNSFGSNQQKKRGPTIESITTSSAVIISAENGNSQAENSVAIDPISPNYGLNSNMSLATVYTYFDPYRTTFTENYLDPSNSILGLSNFESASNGSSGSWTGNIAYPVNSSNNPAADPSAAIDNSGNYYISYLDAQINSLNQELILGVNLAKSTDRGGSSGGSSDWTIHTDVASGSLDKDHLCVDNNPHSPGNGNLYLGWMNDDGYTAQVQMSSNQGTAWHYKQTISSGTLIDRAALGSIPKDAGDQGICLRTGPNGHVYACWGVFDYWGFKHEAAIGFALSTDKGQDWKTPSLYTSSFYPTSTTHAIPVTTDIGQYGLDDQNPSYPTDHNKNMEVNSFPSMAVSQLNGDIYIVWADRGSTTYPTGSINVLFQRSTDEGYTWLSTPVIVNQNNPGGYYGNDSWLPWIACDPISGAIVVEFYDSRNSTYNDGAETFAAVSYDNGTTWTDGQISASGSAWNASGMFESSGCGCDYDPPNYTTGMWAGDYIGVDANYCNVLPVWTDLASDGTDYEAVTNPSVIDCPDNLSICREDVYGNAMHSVTNNLIIAGSGCSYKVESTGICVHQAGNSVNVGDGFNAVNGSVYHSYISGTCSSYCEKIALFSSIAQKGYQQPTTMIPAHNALIASFTSPLNTSIFPNPLKTKATIQYVLDNPSQVTLTVYNILGEEITELVNTVETAGTHRVVFDASNLPTGSYVYVLRTADGVDSKTMYLIK